MKDGRNDLRTERLTREFISIHDTLMNWSLVMDGINL